MLQYSGQSTTFINLLLPNQPAPSLRPPPIRPRPAVLSPLSSLLIVMVEAGPQISAQASPVDNSFQRAVGAAGIFPKNGPDPSARSWAHHQSGVTFAAQHKLPKLPLPSLESSCQRYLRALRPLQSTQEHTASVAAVHTFLHGEGPILQAQLEEYNSTQENYFEHFGESIGPV